MQVGGKEGSPEAGACILVCECLGVLVYVRVPCLRISSGDNITCLSPHRGTHVFHPPSHITKRDFYRYIFIIRVSIIG